MLKDPHTIARIEKNRHAVIARIAEEVKERMKRFPPCHDWWHIERARKIGRHIALVEGADPYVVDLALLMHDIADPKFMATTSPTSAYLARQIMWRLKVGSGIVIDEVCAIIDGMPFSSRSTFGSMPTLNSGVAQDADMLDAMGVIGIARAFTTGAYRLTLQ